MQEVDAYDHAQSVFGPSAGVWQAAPERCLVGRWVPLGELEVSEAQVILRSKRQGFEVIGEGATWALAFTAAQSFRIEPSPKSASKTSNGSTHGDEFGPVLEGEAAQ